MIIVSCRNAFWDNEELADKNDWTNQIAVFRNRRLEEMDRLLRPGYRIHMARR